MTNSILQGILPLRLLGLGLLPLLSRNNREGSLIKTQIKLTPTEPTKGTFVLLVDRFSGVESPDRAVMKINKDGCKGEGSFLWLFDRLFGSL